MNEPPLPDLASIRAARERIAPHVLRTPLLRSTALSTIAGGPVYLKCENLQRTGSFKIRGATNAVLSLSESDRSHGVVTYSSGNHGQALALAARIGGTRAVVCMPRNAPSPKVEAARGYGAEVRFAGTTSAERKLAAEDAVAREGLVMIPPFDDRRVIEGQATVGLEVGEDRPDADVVITPAGGGGLLSGVSLALSFDARERDVIGVEPTGADCVAAAIAAGRPVEIAPPRSIADGLQPLRTGELPFAIVRRHVSRMVQVEESEIVAALRFLATRCKLVVEPSGCVGVAALMSGRIPLNGRTAVIVLSGGNVDAAVFASLLGDGSLDRTG